MSNTLGDKLTVSYYIQQNYAVRQKTEIPKLESENLFGGNGKGVTGL